MALIIGTILALLSLGVAVYPFARRRLGMDKAARTAAAGGTESAETESETGPDTASLADIYAAIRTLQLERELGRIPEGLYQEQLNDYRIQAALALRRQEQEQEQQTAAAPAGRDADAALESEIQAARAGLRRAAGDGGAAAGPAERE